MEKEIYALYKLNPQNGTKEYKLFTSRFAVAEVWSEGDGTPTIYDYEIIPIKDFTGIEAGNQAWKNILKEFRS